MFNALSERSKAGKKVGLKLIILYQSAGLSQSKNFYIDRSIYILKKKQCQLNVVYKV